MTQETQIGKDEDYDPVLDGRKSSAAEDFRNHKDWQRFATWVARVLNSVSVTTPVRVNVGLRVLQLHEDGQYVSETTLREMAYAEQRLYTELRS